MREGLLAVLFVLRARGQTSCTPISLDPSLSLEQCKTLTIPDVEYLATNRECSVALRIWEYENASGTQAQLDAMLPDIPDETLFQLKAYGNATLNPALMNPSG